MTREEINNIPFKWQSHTAGAYEHTMFYSAEYKGHQFALCDHQPYKNGVPYGRNYRHYAVDGKVFKTKEKFYEYCETLCVIKKI